MDWEEEERVRDKDIVAASECMGLIVFETLCGIYVMVDCIYYNSSVWLIRLCMFTLNSKHGR